MSSTGGWASFGPVRMDAMYSRQTRQGKKEEEKNELDINVMDHRTGL